MGRVTHTAQRKFVARSGMWSVWKDLPFGPTSARRYSAVMLRSGWRAHTLGCVDSPVSCRPPEASVRTLSIAGKMAIS